MTAKAKTVVKLAALVLLVGFLGLELRGMIEHGRAASEAARTPQCMNNLKQIGRAIATYCQPPVDGEPEFGPFPPGTIPVPGLPLERRCGWAALVTFRDRDGCPACPVVDPARAWDEQPDPGHDEFVGCPGRPKPSAPPSPRPAAYIGIAGLGVDAPALPKTDRRAGIFGDDRIVTPADVTDGLAQTMMVVESAAPAGPWFAGGRNTVRGLDQSRQPYIGQNHHRSYAVVDIYPGKLVGRVAG